VATAPDLIRFLRACYRADNRAGGVLDLFAASVELRRGLERDALLSGELDWLPVPEPDFAALARAAALYRREKALVYYALPVVARVAEAGAPGRTLCAPLLFFPARIEDGGSAPEGVLELRIEPEAFRLNAPALELILGDDSGADLEALWAELPPAPWRGGGLQDLAARLGERIPGLETLELLRHPALLSDGALRAAVAEVGAGAPPRCLPACGLALLERSPETRGILYELASLAGAGRLSPPLGSLLAAEPAAGSPVRSPDLLPTTLSVAQSRAVSSARRHALTLVIGPPGTGKSFTAAALALDHVARGESVLIAARTSEALDVVEEKLGSMLGAEPPALRVGRGATLKRAKARLEALLEGRLPYAPDATTRELRRLLSRCDRRLGRDARALVRGGRLEESWGVGYGEELGRLGGLWRRVRSGAIAARLATLAPLWTLARRYERALEEREMLASRALRAAIHETLERTLRSHRAQLRGLRDALRARHSSRQDRLFADLDFGVLLRAFPLWITRLQDAHRGLPLEPGLFDLVVLDEATQCDMAGALPVLQRARRVAVFGDPRQLRHVSFLARVRQGALADRFGLDEPQRECFDYRSRSLIDLAADRLTRGEQVARLDEHFRSAPAIIGFSNREFYGGELRVMTRRPETERAGALELVRVAGRRGEPGTNLAEAEAVCVDLAKLVEDEAALPPGLRHSLGVLSPFRAQVDHLRERLGERLSLSSLEKHDVLIGTPYSFQGAERDVVYLSLAVDDASSAGSLKYLQRDDVFNVAITRARARQRVYASIDHQRLPTDSLLRRYLEHAGSATSPGCAAGTPGDAFASEVAAALRERGYRIWSGYTVAGSPVDLLAGKGGRSVGIDLIGYPGALAPALELERCRSLRRGGLSVFPLALSAWDRDPGGCLDAFGRAFDEAGG